MCLPAAPIPPGCKETGAIGQSLESVPQLLQEESACLPLGDSPLGFLFKGHLGAFNTLPFPGTFPPMSPKHFRGVNEESSEPLYGVDFISLIVQRGETEAQNGT